MKLLSLLAGVVTSVGCAGAVNPRTRQSDAEPLYQHALAVARGGDASRTLSALRVALQAGACSTRALTERLFTDLHAEPRFRELIRTHARQSSAVLVSPDEPGTPLAVTGMVRRTDGRPVAGALVHVFHTDANGKYTPSQPMDEPHSRIFGYMRTDADGRYEFHTVRPGGYPSTVELGGQARLIPEHIHFEVEADGFEPTRFQLVFDDDPRMDGYWRTRWAPSMKAPIVKPTVDTTGTQRCGHDITLHAQPNGMEPG